MKTKTRRYTVRLEYQDSNCWDTEHLATMVEARNLAQEHLNACAHCRCRVKIYDQARPGRYFLMTQYGHSAGWVEDLRF